MSSFLEDTHIEPVLLSFADAEQPVAGAYALGEAAYSALVTLFPDDAEALFRALYSYEEVLGRYVDMHTVRSAVIWGRQVVKEMIADREGDGAFAGQPFVVRL